MPLSQNINYPDILVFSPPPSESQGNKLGRPQRAIHILYTVK